LSGDWRVVGAVLFGLACFGWGYDRWVAGLEARGEARGYMAFIVALGCLVTLGGFVLIAGVIEPGIVALLCFMASGLPMIVGSVARYAQARAREEIRARAEAEATLDDG